MSTLIPPLTISVTDLASLFRWPRSRVYRWFSHVGRESKQISLLSIMGIDPELWASVQRRQQIEEMADSTGRSILRTDYTIAEVAKLYGWSRPRVYRWLRDRHVKMIQITANRKAIPLTSLMAADEDLWRSLLLRLRLERAMVES